MAGGAWGRNELISGSRELVALARSLGYRPDELTEIIEQVS